MATKLAILKSQLLTSGLSSKDQPLFQIISQLIDYLQQTTIATQEIAASAGGSTTAITGLNTDVVATGPGNVVATIQPNVVNYSKIQQVAALRLLGNASAILADVMEIALGTNLSFDGTTLDVVIPDSGGTGLQHRVLSTTHLDSVPDLALRGDLIYATAGPPLEGMYFGFYLNSPVVEDFVGLRFGYYAGFHGAFTPTNSMGYCPENLTFITTPAIDQYLAFEYTDFYLLALVVEDFIGLRLGYIVTVANFVTGNNYGYYPPELAFVAPPNPENDNIAGLWTRKAIGTEGQVLTVVDGLPEWQDLPPIPDEPEYPWQDITFAAGDFTASGGTTPTWTVASGDVKRWQQQRFPGVGGVGNNVRVALYLRDTTVGGTAPTQLRIALPFNIIGRFAQFISIQEAGAASTDVFVEYDDSVSTNTLFINKIAGAVFDTTAGGTFLAFEISAVLAP